MLRFWRERISRELPAPYVVNDDVFGTVSIKFKPIEGHTLNTFYMGWTAWFLLNKPFLDPLSIESWSAHNWDIVHTPNRVPVGKIETIPHTFLPADKSNMTLQLVNGDASLIQPLRQPYPPPIGIHVGVEYHGDRIAPTSELDIFKEQLAFMLSASANYKPHPDDPGVEHAFIYSNDDALGAFQYLREPTESHDPPDVNDFAEGLRQILEKVVRERHYESFSSNIMRGGTVIALFDMKTLPGVASA